MVVCSPVTWTPRPRLRASEVVSIWSSSLLASPSNRPVWTRNFRAPFSTGADTGGDAPAGFRNESDVALELNDVACFDDVVVGHVRVDDGEHDRHRDGQCEHRQCRADGATVDAKEPHISRHPALFGFESRRCG